LQGMLNDNPSKIVLVVEYDGTRYYGFQYQINTPSIQDEIEKGLTKLTGINLRVVSASRTDTGVHAKGQVVSFRINSNLDTIGYKNGLNHFLPPDIAVKAAYKVNQNFNVQLDVISREYRYVIYNSRIRSPFQRLFSYQVSGELNTDDMNRASQLLIGEHDLASFVSDYSDSSVKSTLRRVYKTLVSRKDNLVYFDIIAKSYLPHQVRNTVGALIKVGLGKMKVEDFQTIMEARKPGTAGPKAPAQGLYLMQVNYPRPLGDYDENL
jgi:tRNA pseudouridine38-40 synthase